MAGRHSTTYGFKRTSALLQSSVRRASESRGFAKARLLTHWTEIVGEEIAAVARPVEVSYARQGMGATLTVLTTGAQAPMLEMQKEKLRDRVNAVYGFNAIVRIRITQTAATGFAEGQVSFDHCPVPNKAVSVTPAPETKRDAADLTASLSDDGLRNALESLARNVLTKSRR